MQLPGLNIGIVADDLTGANDTALQFFLAGMPTHVLLSLQTLDDRDCEGSLAIEQRQSQAWSLNTDSRHLDKNAAEAAVRRAVSILRDRFGVENFYKKMDSTLRGHLAHECLGFLDELKADCVVIVPAFPQEGRRTVGGYQLVRGMPVERTHVVRDPMFPVRQSHIPTLLEQSTKPEIVGYIPLSTVLHGAGPILVELGERIKAGKKLVVIDATSNEDLEQIALAIEKIQNTARVLPCGSAGLAQALTKLWVDQADTHTTTPKEELQFAETPILIVSGSNSETTRHQVMQLIENYPYYGEDTNLGIFELSPEKILGLENYRNDLPDILNALGTANTVILSTSLRDDTFAATIALAKERDIPEKQVHRMAQEALANLTQAILAERQVKLILTGGETASKVCRTLGSHSARLIDEAQPAVPLMIDERGHWMITKSGNFGEAMTLANLIRFIKDHDISAIRS